MWGVEGSANERRSTRRVDVREFALDASEGASDDVVLGVEGAELEPGVVGVGDDEGPSAGRNDARLRGGVERRVAEADGDVREGMDVEGVLDGVDAGQIHNTCWRCRRHRR